MHFHILSSYLIQISYACTALELQTLKAETNVTLETSSAKLPPITKQPITTTYNRTRGKCLASVFNEKTHIETTEIKSLHDLIIPWPALETNNRCLKSIFYHQSTSSVPLVKEIDDKKAFM